MWYWDIDEELQKINLKLDVLYQELRAFRREDAEGDVIMSAETQKAIEELKAEIGPLTDGVTAVEATVDRILKMVEDSADDPAQLREVISSIRSNKDRIVAAAAKGTPIDPSGNVQ